MRPMGGLSTPGARLTALARAFPASPMASCFRDLSAAVGLHRVSVRTTKSLASCAPYAKEWALRLYCLAMPSEGSAMTISIAQAGRVAVDSQPAPSPAAGLRPWRGDEGSIDLSFNENWRPYATHSLHPFPAKFPPALVRWAIERFTNLGEWLLDPFVGSGTTLVEARLLGRNAMAAEIDPLSRLIARVKARPIDPAVFEPDGAWLNHIWDGYPRSKQTSQASRREALPEFPNRDYWFHPQVQRDLLVLRDAIARIEDAAVRDFLLVVYSSIIIAKGPSSVANALDIAHSRSHHVPRPAPPEVWARFRDRYRRALRGMSEFHAMAEHDVETVLLGHDARKLPYTPQSADAILTSPPYVTAIDYPRGHKFSVWWIGQLLGVSHRAYEQLRYEYIGTESVPTKERAELRKHPIGLPTIDRVVTAVDDVDERRGGQARRYFLDMQLALGEMLRTLRAQRYAVLVVGNCNLRGVRVPTGSCLVEMAESLEVDGARFVHRDTLTRTIRERSRQMPIKRGRNGDGIQTEQILVLQKCSTRTQFAIPSRNGYHRSGAQALTGNGQAGRTSAAPI